MRTTRTAHRLTCERAGPGRNDPSPGPAYVATTALLAKIALCNYTGGCGVQNAEQRRQQVSGVTGGALRSILFHWPPGQSFNDG